MFSVVILNDFTTWNEFHDNIRKPMEAWLADNIKGGYDYISAHNGDYDGIDFESFADALAFFFVFSDQLEAGILETK